MFSEKHITVYVTGGIAAYKACHVVRLFIKAGADVRVVMSEAATKFVTPLTFQMLSKNDVYVDTFLEKNSNQVAHIHLADWTDLAIVVPATANTIAKIANGIADNMVSTALLATTAPIFVIPAMNTHMLENFATKRNLNILVQADIGVMESATGFLAEGYEGKGRLPEPEEIFAAASLFYLQKQTNLPLKNKKVLVTAGGTKERIDPVRFITNDSSGKMGYAVAEVARDLGAEVILISAASLPAPFGVKIEQVASAKEMQQAVEKYFANVDIIVMAAAVSDYTPEQVAKEKTKKGNTEEWSLDLIRTTDILATLGQKKTHQFLIGFAAETQNLLDYAEQKLSKKNADMIVANDVSKAGVGFNQDTNEVTILRPTKEPIKIAMKSKKAIAQDILTIAVQEL